MVLALRHTTPLVTVIPLRCDGGHSTEITIIWTHSTRAAGITTDRVTPMLGNGISGTPKAALKNSRGT